MQQKQIYIYQNLEGKPVVELKNGQQAVWLSKAEIAKLFQRSQGGVWRHIQLIFKDKELEEEGNIRFMDIGTAGKANVVYSLKVVINLAARINSPLATQFRLWGNQVLHDKLRQGCAPAKTRLEDQDALIIKLKETVTLLCRVFDRIELTAEHLIKELYRETDESAIDNLE
jgi:hypothetical protein